MRRTVLLVALALLIAGTAVLGASAQSNDPQNSTPLGNRVPVNGTLVGNRAGAFHYYCIDYPGDGSVVTVRMTFVPGDPVTLQSVGVNVWGKDAFLIGQAEIRFDGQKGIATLQYADRTPATWLIQVFNYLPDTAMHYTLEVTGLPGPPATPTPGPVVPNNVADVLAADARFDALEQALKAASLFRVLQGQGSFTLFAPTDAAFERLPAGTLEALLGDPVRLSVTLLYHVAAEELTTQQLSGRTSLGSLARLPLQITQTDGTVRANDAAITAGDIQASNGVIHAVDAVLVPPEALYTVGAQLPGNRGGAFARYPFFYPGDDVAVEVTLTVHNFAAALRNAFGVAIYGPQGKAGEGSQVEATNRLSATIRSDVPGTYVVQVYNYAPEYTMHYTLSYD